MTVLLEFVTALLEYFQKTCNLLATTKMMIMRNSLSKQVLILLLLTMLYSKYAPYRSTNMLQGMY